MPRLFTVLLLLGPLALHANADGIKDNDPSKVRQVPRAGVSVSEADAAELRTGLADFDRRIADLRSSKDDRVQGLLPDVEIFRRAVFCALEYNEFFAPRDIQKAKRLLKVGKQRAVDLKAGNAPWTTQTGLVVRGYRSKIDHTVQPYGLVIPETYTSTGLRPFRCDLWFHGRGETLSEVNFIDQRLRQVGLYAPANTFVLHPYGRYSNAFKFAGEIDVLEALEHARKSYRLDKERTSVRGFSMGGAACWQFAVHYADRWFAANPGAGFSETPDFLKSFQKETLKPLWFERRLWMWYDCPGYALNLAHCPTIAYSGELDIQKQAAEIMEPAIERQGMKLLHLIGPKTKHAIHPESMKEIERRMDSLAELGRDRFPNPLHFTTHTLRYNRMSWIEVTALKEHWKQARVDARWRGNSIQLEVNNVDALTVSFPPGHSPFRIGEISVTINGDDLDPVTNNSDRSLSIPIHLTGSTWSHGKLPQVRRKKPTLQGPIDDAFMDSFIFVTPSGESGNKKFQAWQQTEFSRARNQWRQHFRGDARVKRDSEVTEDDIASANLILWGDPKSNAILKRIVDSLPITWDSDQIKAGKRTYSSKDHGLIMIYPNPLNEKRYIVLNSGFTYREYAYLNNARQVPMLPDWAVIDLRTPAGTQYPGKVADGDFFGEKWELEFSPENQK